MGNAKIVFSPFEPASSRKFRRLSMEGLAEDGLLYGRHLLVLVLEMAKRATCKHDSTSAQNPEIIGTDCASGAVIRSCLRDNRLEEAITLMKVWTSEGETIFKRYCTG